jgi:hypothetical protein
VKYPHQDPIDDQLEQLKEIMDQTVFHDWHVTEEMKSSLMARIQRETQHSYSTNSKRFLPKLAVGALVICAILAFTGLHPVNTVNTDLSGFVKQNKSSYGSSSASAPSSGLSAADTVKRQDAGTTQAKDQLADPILPFHQGHSTSTAGEPTSDVGSTSSSHPVVIASRVQEQKEQSDEKVLNGVLNPKGDNTNSRIQTQNNQNVTDQSSMTKDTLIPSSPPQSTVSGLLPLDIPVNLPTAGATNGVMSAPTARVADGATLNPNIQQLIQLANGNPIIFGKTQNGRMSVYKLPNPTYYYGWVSDGEIGIYVLPSWKLPIQVTQSEFNSVQQISGLSVISSFGIIETNRIPDHVPYFNQADPIRLMLLQLTAEHQLYAYQLNDGSVAFFSPKQKGEHPSTHIDSLPNPAFAFIARISDPALYFYKDVSVIPWMDLKNQIQWLTPKKSIAETSTALSKYPFYP